MNGVDVSYIQKNVDWQKVKSAGIKFAFLRIGYGKEESQKDAMFESHYAEATKAGILVGGYYYSYAIDTEGAMEEAKACLAMLNKKTFDLPIAYDIEEAEQFALSSETLYRIYKTFAGILEREGYKTMLYTNKNWLENKWDKTELLNDNTDIWLAQYNHTITYDGPLKVSIWQNQSNAEIDGISEQVDTDILLVQLSELYTSKSVWKKENDRWWYQRFDGSYPKNQWEKIDGVWYYFDKDGWMQVGWISDKGKWYYCDLESGAMIHDKLITIESPIYGPEQYAFGGDGHMLISDARGALK